MNNESHNRNNEHGVYSKMIGGEGGKEVCKKNNFEEFS